MSILVKRERQMLTVFPLSLVSDKNPSITLLKNSFILSTFIINRNKIAISIIIEKK